LKIRRTDHGAGTVTGGLLGSLVGLPLGVGVWMSVNVVTLGAESKSSLLIFGIAGGAAAVGAILGALEGNTQDLDFEEAPPGEGSVPDSTLPGGR
jgi:hypothetical protein